MAGPKLDEWNAGSLAKSVNSHLPDFQSDLQLDNTTVNVTSGVREGIGPRFGFAPIPGHMDQEAPVGLKLPGLMRSELGYQIPTSIDQFRRGVHGVVKFVFNIPTKNPSQSYYVWVVTFTDNTVTYIDVLLSSLPDLFSLRGVQQIQASSNIYDGLQYFGNFFTQGGSIALNSSAELSFELVGSAGHTLQKVVSFEQLTQIDPNLRFSSVTPFSISNPKVSMPWVYGLESGALPDATHAPSVSLFSGGIVSYTFGLPSEFNTQDFPKNERSLVVYGLDNSYAQTLEYSLQFNANSSIYLPTYMEDVSVNTNMDFSGVTATKISGTTYNTTQWVLVNDKNIGTDASFQGVLVAAGKALCVIFQDWYRNAFGASNQYVDLVNLPSEPTVVNTTTYKEDGAVTKTSFSDWPQFITGTAMGTGVSGLSLGAANSGILRANTIYEFTYSHYNKRLNFESNVGTPVKFQTGSNDFVSLILANLSSGSTIAGAANNILPFFDPVGSVSYPRVTNPYHLNYLEYRFYYREFGTQEWLPAFFIEAPKWWFYPHVNFVACTGGIGGLLGGRPGGFIDYSRLPQDSYNCVLFYKNRAFWLSDKAMVYSLTNNIFAYAQRNSVAAPAGSFKGALVHAYPGQAEQNSRLVVISTHGIYVGRFSGNLLQQPVQVAVDTVANFGLDGSDFVLDAWTSSTAFSYRSAVVAEGVLYFWGPQGVFRDDGVNVPTRISLPIEPDLFNLYDPSSTDEIHASYNDMTKEITWYYPPKNADGFGTHAIVYNRVRESWLPQKYTGKIDHTTNLTIDTGIPTAGHRLISFARESSSTDIQRAYFYDQNNLAGDIFPKRELMVKSFTTPSTGVRRLTLAAGYDASSFSSAVLVGDQIALQQLSSYATTLTTPSDFVATISAVNHGAGTIDITLTTGATMDASATFATNELFFPIWHQAQANAVSIYGSNGLNGFPYSISSKYWVPAGMSYWAYWLYLHFVFKLNLSLPSASGIATTLTYRTPISTASLSDVIDLVDNSDGNFQVLHKLRVGQSAFEGQGLKLSLSGVQLAGSWMLQYLQAFSQLRDGLQLKHFED